MNLGRIEEALEAASDDIIGSYGITEDGGCFIVYHNYETYGQEYEYNNETEWLANTLHFNDKREFLNWLKGALK